MVIERRIQRHQLTCFLKVFNRFTDKPMGYLGNVSEGGLMLISQLPLLVDADFELRLKLPGADGCVQWVDLTARCLWCREDMTPNFYDSGFILYQPPAEYLKLINDLSQYFSFHPLQTSA
ncbi:PilZ domain-containing protein [Pseudomonas psychrophila]|uniref:PilZ domain-containing protein n=1 Tax=Pseudomonas psychrophila TaxID=122355 RepID=UPI00030C069E|nr:PilZ domain-containing protein [Pseudomonas psychrophila]